MGCYLIGTRNGEIQTWVRWVGSHRFAIRAITLTHILLEGLLIAVQKRISFPIRTHYLKRDVLALEKRGYLNLKDITTYCLMTVQTKVLFEKCIFPFVIHSLFHMLFVT